MKKLMGLFLLAACGNSTVHLTGEATIRHVIDLEIFEKYYRKQCEELFTEEVDIVACTDEKMAELLEALVAQGVL